MRQPVNILRPEDFTGTPACLFGLWMLSLEALEMHLPGHVEVLSRAVAFDQTADWDQSLEEAFKSLPPVSIDYGVMEKAQNVCCVASTFSWHDVGGWLALKNFLPEDQAGNCCQGRDVDTGRNGQCRFLRRSS